MGRFIAMAEDPLDRDGVLHGHDLLRSAYKSMGNGLYAAAALVNDEDTRALLRNLVILHFLLFKTEPGQLEICPKLFGWEGSLNGPYINYISYISL